MNKSSQKMVFFIAGEMISLFSLHDFRHDDLDFKMRREKW